MGRLAEQWTRLERLLRERARQAGGEFISARELAILCGVVETTPELNERHADSVLIGAGERRAETLRALYGNRYGDPRVEDGELYATSGLLELARDQEMAAAGAE